ncbi:MAG: McrC family protein [Muribaculaceae bacterium]
MVTMVFRDNTKYSPECKPEEFLLFSSIANRKISDLLDDRGNDLLIYPHSFMQCKDKMGGQYLFTLQTNWKAGKCTEVVLETGNMAGFIGMNGQSISILSRFSKNAEDFFLHYMLQKVLCLNVVNLSHGTTNEQIFSFLIYLFPKFLKEALSQGIYKEYQRKEYNDANVRGTIDINRHLKTNLPFNGRVAYRTREFSYDNHITELIRHTIDYINKTSFGQALLESDAETRASVAQIISATPSYSRQEREKVINSNSRITSHPYYFRYTPLQKLCLRILRHENNKYGEKDDKIYGILFDVSYLWEEYLASILIEHKFIHPNNRDKTEPIYLAEKDLPRYPDFYREEDNIIIDAKYKREISRDDIHQMITYMYRLKGKKGILIQPSEKIRKTESYYLLGYGKECNSTLQKYYYQISQTTDDYKRFVTEMVSSENCLKLNYI